MEVINGILFHAVGASGAALCYTPQKKVTGWAWQTYWIAQAAVCWLILPIVVAFLTIPELALVLQEAPASAMIKSFLLGLAYGIGGTAFGIAIRYVGFSLTYAIAVGISCVLGTLLPPFMNGTLAAKLAGNESNFIVAGLIAGVAGIALCGVAGRKKENDIETNTGDQRTFSLKKGLPLCLLAGVLSAFYGFAIDQGQPIAEAAARHGAGYFQVNAVYIFSNSGAFLSTLIYCSALHTKEGTWNQFTKTGGGNFMNFFLSALTGILWYGQFFFYGLGHLRMGEFSFTSWAIHMIMLVLFSLLAGIAMKEWDRTSRATKLFLSLALLVLVSSVLLLTYGNYLGDK